MTKVLGDIGLEGVPVSSKHYTQSLVLAVRRGLSC